MNRTKRLSMDTILLLAGATLYVVDFSGVTGALLVLTVGAYAIFDSLAWTNRAGISLQRLFDLKLTLVLLAIFLVVVLPTVSWMLMRQGTAPWEYIHDGAIQIEESIKYLLQGKNPYTENYLGTPLAQWEYLDGGMAENPALYHNAYLPFIFVFSTPFYIVVKHVTGWYDQRLVYLLFFVCTLWPLMQHAGDQTRKLGLLILFGLNFFAVSYIIWGGNDVFVMFWLVMSTYLLQRDRTAAAAVSLGLACASKHTAWLFVPFFITYVWGRTSPLKEPASLRQLCPILVVPLLLILPFLLWDAASFVDDTYLYLAGHTESSYPIKGPGFGGLLLAFGLIGDKTASFPFILFQAAFCLPLLVFLVRTQLSDNTVRRCWLGYGLLLLTFIFFSRFFSMFYLGTIVSALALGWLSQDTGQEARKWEQI